MIEVTNYI